MVAPSTAPYEVSDAQAARFWKRVAKTDSCWNWLGSLTRSGYGHVGVGKTWGDDPYRRRMLVRLAHRIAYELTKGPIPTGLTLDHLCRNRRCVNPEHLEPVTMGENMRRGISPAAQHAKATHCIRGHPFSGRNLAQWASGRHCKTCRRIINQQRNTDENYHV